MGTWHSTQPETACSKRALWGMGWVGLVTQESSSTSSSSDRFSKTRKQPELVGCFLRASSLRRWATLQSHDPPHSPPALVLPQRPEVIPARPSSRPRQDEQPSAARLHAPNSAPPNTLARFSLFTFFHFSARLSKKERREIPTARSFRSLSLAAQKIRRGKAARISASQRRAGPARKQPERGQRADLS